MWRIICVSKGGSRCFNWLRFIADVFLHHWHAYQPLTAVILSKVVERAS